MSTTHKRRKGYSNPLKQKEARFRYNLRRGAILPRATDSIIGNYKEPLTKYSDGYGYMGALVYDKDEQFTQCHECGYFYKFLGMHVKQEHGQEVRDYKDKFQLNRRTSLLATNTRSIFTRSSTFSHWTDEDWQNHRERMAASRDERVARLVKSNIEGKSQRPKSLEQKNIEGRCPEQLLDKLKKLEVRLGRTPKRKEFVKEYGHGFNNALRSTFGSYGEAIKILGLAPNKPGAAVYTPANLLQILRDFSKHYGRVPMSCDIRTFKLPSLDVYRKHFGTFREAKMLALGKTADATGVSNVTD